MDEWYPIQVKQSDKMGRPEIDQFEAAMMRENRNKGYCVAFDNRRCTSGKSADSRREQVAKLSQLGSVSY